MIELPHASPDVRRIVDVLLKSPSHHEVTLLAVKAIADGKPNPYQALRRHLAVAYANGYVQGWKMREKSRGEVIVPPE